MNTKLRFAVALLALFAVSGCQTLDWIKGKLGIDHALALNDMETRFNGLWAERQKIKQLNKSDPAIYPLILDTVQADFKTLYDDAKARAGQITDTQPQQELFFKARFFHLAARAAIGSAHLAEADAGPLARDLKTVCTEKLSNVYYKNSAICLSGDLLIPTAVANYAMRKIDQDLTALAADKTAETKPLITNATALFDQYKKMKAFTLAQTTKNDGLSALLKKNKTAIYCALYMVYARVSPAQKTTPDFQTVKNQYKDIASTDALSPNDCPG